MTDRKSARHIIIGGGAAGYFGAISCAEANPSSEVIILEKTRQPLAKVRISGGGRCNVTHACFDPKALIENYPRGSKELLGPFHQFQPKDTIHWFEQRGVKIKAEEDGRMFPVTDSSQTIIDCLINETKRLGVQVKFESGVDKISKNGDQFTIELSNGTIIYSDSVFIATGSTPKVFQLISQLGHTIVPLVPSLFTFNVPTSRLSDLAGISVSKATVTIAGSSFVQTGPVLITHWGLSGPAVLKLSAFAARHLHGLDYKAKALVNWIPEESESQVLSAFDKMKVEFSGKQMSTEVPFQLPKQLWKRVLELTGINPEQRWRELSKKQMMQLASILQSMEFQIDGKTTYKQEFVTCGGVSLKEVNFKTMESKICPGLYFAGEVLDVDGITGGFNFQNAWTTGWIAGRSMAGKSQSY